MSDIIEKLASSGHLTPAQRARVEKNVEEFVKAAEEYPELMQEAMEKVGFWGSAKPDWGRTAAQIGGAVGLAAVGSVAADMYKDVKNSLNKARSYKEMLKENPDLAKMPAKKTQAVFNTLNTLNPTYAGDPLVAGSFVRNTMEMERMDVGGLKNIVEGYRHHQQAQGGLGFDDLLTRGIAGGPLVYSKG